MTTAISTKETNVTKSETKKKNGVDSSVKEKFENIKSKLIEESKAPSFFVNFEEIQRHPQFKNSRRDESQGINDLKTSLMNRGLIHPLYVWEPDDDPGKLYLISGFRRYRAIENIKIEHPEEFEQVEVKKFNGPIEEAMDHNFTENLQRLDLKTTEKASYLVELSDAHKRATGKELTHSELALRLGVDRTWVTKLLNWHRSASTNKKADEGVQVTEALKTQVNQERIPFWTAYGIAQKSTKFQLDICERINNAYKKGEGEGKKEAKKVSSEIRRSTRKKKDILLKLKKLSELDFDDRKKAYDQLLTYHSDDEKSKQGLQMAVDMILAWQAEKWLSWALGYDVDLDSVEPEKGTFLKPEEWEEIFPDPSGKKKE